MIKIIVDAYGGDRSPQANVDGVKQALNEIEDIEIVLVGRQNELEPMFTDLKKGKDRLTFVDAKDEISCNDEPVKALREKKDSSLVKALDLLHDDDSMNALVSVGSTGAIIAGAVLKIGRIKGVKRPGFCPILPTMNGGLVGVCDSGANVDCDSTQLLQFGIMASLYMQKAYNVESPRVALLNIGVEEHKGDNLRKEVYGLLKNAKHINFVGNMESRDFLSGNFDVVVCDGFGGNVLLKATEGACLEMLKVLKKTLTKNLKNKIGALLLKKDVYALKDYMDYNNYGGAVLLGTKKTIVKGHGSSKAISIFKCIEQAYNMEKNGLNKAIGEEIATINIQTENKD